MLKKKVKRGKGVYILGPIWVIGVMSRTDVARFGHFVAMLAGTSDPGLRGSGRSRSLMHSATSRRSSIQESPFSNQCQASSNPPLS